MHPIVTEVLVIGSGFGAAAPALRLAQAGLQVLMIEKGPDIVPARDFQQTQDPKYLLRYIKGIRGNHVRFTFAEGLGGGSGFYEMVSLRAPSVAFEQKGPDGIRLWPPGITRASMDPHYALAEKNMHVVQIAPGEIPKNGLVFCFMMKRLGYSVDRVPYSVRMCEGSAFCVGGCTTNGKVTLHDTYLDPARRAGMKVITGFEADLIRHIPVDTDDYLRRDLGTIPPRYEVVCRGAGSDLLVRAKVVLLAGGTVGTARILMKSRRSLPMLSNHVGKNISMNGTVKSLGILPEGFLQGDMFTGRSHPGVISYEFLDSHGITISTSKPLPVDAVSYANLVPEGETRTPSSWGQPKVELMKLYRRRAFVLYALGLVTATAELLPVRGGEVRPSFTLDGTYREYHQRTLELLHSILQRSGARIVHIKVLDESGSEYDDLFVTTAHMTGSCRMAGDPAHGVVNATGEVFCYPGLFVTDGAAIPSSLAVNPYLTILANAERIGATLAQRYGRPALQVAA